MAITDEMITRLRSMAAAGGPPGRAGAGEAAVPDGVGPGGAWRCVEELYARIRAAGPLGHAEAGLDELAVLLGVSGQPAAEATYSFYVLEDEGWSRSVRHSATVVACDADEIRWACDEWLALSDGGFGTLTLTAYVDGAEVSSIDLGQHRIDEVVDWAAVAVPDLSGPRLPVGLPVPSRGLYYGFSGRAD